MPRNFSDQRNLFDPDSVGFPVHVIGAGGIGSTVIQTLAKMGYPIIEVWDNDTFEMRNGPSEPPYSESYFGLPKVEVAKRMVEYLLGEREKSTKIIPHAKRVTAETRLEGYVICGVDSNTSRKAIFDAVRASSVNIPFFIDARSAGEMYQVFSLLPLDHKATKDYMGWLFDDKEALPLECGARNIAYVSNGIATLVTRNLTKAIRGEKVPFMIAENLATLTRTVVD